MFLFTYLHNASLVNTTFIMTAPIIYKLKIFTFLIQGLGTTMTGINLFVLVLNGILIGLNVTLIFQKIVLLKQVGNVSFVAGGSSLLSIVGGGCAACGLPVISLFGLSSVIVYLPYRGAELPYISLFLLFGSLVLLLRNNTLSKVCAVKEKKYRV